jgi:hypothetical protein
MTKIVYLLSDHLDYSRLICNDAGPGYAAAMGWEYINLVNYQQIKNYNVIVVDNRIQENELDALKKIIDDNPSIPFFLKIVDPFYENRGHFYYDFISNMAKWDNVYLLSVYQATEFTKEISELYPNRFITLPYPYLKDKEITNVTHRKNKILLSGAINNVYYPYRYAIWSKITRNLARIFFSILRHPGYTELNSTPSSAHLIIKDDYITYLAKFKYMLLCPTRCMIELLKFNECAYAGCIPVGIPPDSYPGDIKKLFLKLRSSHFYSDLLNILLNDRSDHVKKLRDYLSETRDPDVLNANLITFINENPIRTS